MATTGWRDRIAAAVSRDLSAYKLLDASKERQALDTALSKTLALYKEMESVRDIPVLLAAERLILTHELHNFANSPEDHNSIQTALNQLADAEKAMNIVMLSDAYQKATDTYAAKRMENGLPQDGFREFIKSHVTRLTNRLAGQLSGSEKEILRQRKANLLAARDAYIALQRKALKST
jgi:predicted nucleotidyltransferase